MEEEPGDTVVPSTSDTSALSKEESGKKTLIKEDHARKETSHEAVEDRSPEVVTSSSVSQAPTTGNTGGARYPNSIF